MIATTGTTGTRGLMKIEDNTDGPDKTVDLYIASSAPISVPNLGWSYSLDGVASSIASFNVTNTTAWQHVAKVFVGYASRVAFHIEASGTAELGGPTDLSVDLQNGTKVVFVKVDGVWQPAIPFVFTGGAWQPATPYVFVNSQWTEVV